MKIKDILQKKEFQNPIVSDCVVLTFMYKFVEDFISDQDIKNELKTHIDMIIKDLLSKDSETKNKKAELKDDNR